MDSQQPSPGGTRTPPRPTTGPSRVAPRALVVMSEDAWRTQFDRERIDRLRSLADVAEPVWAPDFTAPALRRRLAEVEVLLTGWGTPRLGADELALMPRLQTVLHCAGSIRPLVSDELWRRGVAVSSSADLNAEPVAEYTLAAVVMAGKKAPFLAADARRHRSDWSYRHARGRLSNLGLDIGVVGFSRIGRRVVGMVTTRLSEATCWVADPHADPAAVSRAGGNLVALDEMLPRLDILSIHAPELPSTRHLIDARRLALLPDHATVINTARGSLIETAALEAECRTGRLHAILDVTDPEPLPDTSVLYDLPNVLITPHIAGSLGTETLRMTDGSLQELERLRAGQELVRRIHAADLELFA